MAGNDDATFNDALEGLHRGDFSRLEPLFDDRSGRSGKPQIVEWHEQGRLRDQPKALAEALTCASFLGPHERRGIPLEARRRSLGRRGHRFGRPALGIESWTAGSGSATHPRKGSARNAEHVWRHGSRHGHLVGSQRTATRASADHRRAAQCGCPFGRYGISHRAPAH